MGIRDRPTSPRSPWQNVYAERLIGSIRWECHDHVVVFCERHLRHVLLSYKNYYYETRTHLSLDKDAPLSRTVQRAGRILRFPILGGPHYQYVRIGFATGIAFSNSLSRLITGLARVTVVVGFIVQGLAFEFTASLASLLHAGPENPRTATQRFEGLSANRVYPAASVT